MEWIKKFPDWGTLRVQGFGFTDHKGSPRGLCGDSLVYQGAYKRS